MGTSFRSIACIVVIAILFAALAVHAVKSSVIDAMAISNESMLPYLTPGTRIIILKTSPCIKIPFTTSYVACAPCEPGRAYVFRHPQDMKQRLVKFAQNNTEQNQETCFFEGSNLERSVDSRHFGPVPFNKIEGKVVYPRVMRAP